MSDAPSVLHYASLQPLGAGGMGVVYRALDTRLDRPVALKFLPPGVAVDPQAKQRLVTEAKAAARIDHPNVGVIYGIEESDERLFIVMALYKGRTLEERLQGGPLPYAEALDIAIQAGRGLARAHADGIVHRDVKPANLFLTRDGLVKILDFGLVKLEHTQGVTTPGTIVGTPEYMAPEQIRGLELDARADVWALGVVLYEMLTGVSPFRAEGGLPATILKVMTAQPEPVDALAPGVPPGFGPVLERALARDRDERYATAQELLDDLAGLRRGGAAREADPVAAAPGPAAATPPAARAAASPSSITDVTVELGGIPDASPLLEPVPRVPRFVGRQRQLDALRTRLERDRIVAVRGMAGEGKSTLAAHLARSVYPEDRIFWFTFDPVEKNTADALFWSLAAFLAKRGEPLLWRYLQGEIEAHRALDRTVRLNLFLSSSAAAGCLFCFDDVHLVAGDPEIPELFKALQRLFGGGDEDGASFVLLGRELPPDIEHLGEPLSGFSLEEGLALAEAHGLELPSALMARLADRTYGNPALLELAISALGRMGDDEAAMTAFVESMAGRADIRDYVVNHIYAFLEDDERGVVDALSIFPSSVEPEVAEEVLAVQGLTGIARTVDALIQKSIVQEIDGGRIRCHDLVREYCYRTLEGRTRRQLHGHAAAHYEARENPLAAAHHYREQGDGAKALALLTANVAGIVNAGGAASLLQQLAAFDPDDLDEDGRLAWALARGEALTVTGAYDEARSAYQVALDDTFDDAPRGLLLCRLANVANEHGDHADALGFATEALELHERDGEERHAAEDQRALGMAQYRMGRLDDAKASFAAALAIATRVDDASLTAYLTQYIAFIDARQDRPDIARKLLESTRRTFRELHDRRGEAESLGNLAVVYAQLGDDARALAMFNRVSTILEGIGQVRSLLVHYNNLGDLHHHAGRYAEAVEQYEKLRELATRVDHPAWLTAALVGLAESRLATGEVAAARSDAERALRTLDDGADGEGPIERIMTWRILGDVALAEGDAPSARGWYERSIPALEQAHEQDELAKARRGLEAARAMEGRPSQKEAS